MPGVDEDQKVKKIDRIERTLQEKYEILINENAFFIRESNNFVHLW